MLKKVPSRKKVRTKDFLKFLSPAQRKELLKLAANLKSRKIIHVNATDAGGGVAEILRSLIPYLRALSIKAEWYYIREDAGKKFFETTNKIHNALQGAARKFSREEWNAYEAVNQKITKDLSKLKPDILVIHDPQPLLAGANHRNIKSKILFIHPDISSPYKKIWRKFYPWIEKYDQIVFSNKDFISRDLPQAKIKIFAPAIDPLFSKQKIVAKGKARNYLARYGVPKSGPLVVQVSRFDVWKNPLGVIAAVRLVQKTYPQIRLALVGFNTAHDNPRADDVHKDVQAIAKGDPNIWVFFHPRHHRKIVISEFTMMAQNAADIVVQNSIKEGFGLTVAEAMWKEKPVIGGPASGIRKQITDGKNGFIVKTEEELAQRIEWLLKNPQKARKIARAGKKSVIKNFLFPRLLLDHLRVYSAITKNK